MIGEGSAETDEVFERKVLYTNLPEPAYMGDRKKIMSLLHFADRTSPVLWDLREEILGQMDERGSYQRPNLRTVLCAAEVIAASESPVAASLSSLLENPAKAISAIAHTASLTGFRGRWEKLSDSPCVIADIGHNAHGLKYNFSQLETMRREGQYTHLLMVYGMVADKDVKAVFSLMPHGAEWFFTNATGKRALPASELESEYIRYCSTSGQKAGDTHSSDSVREAVLKALSRADQIVGEIPSALPLIYVGGSTYVVAEAIAVLEKIHS